MPNDAIENVAGADSYTRDKGGHLAATEHLVRWRTRLLSTADRMASCSTPRDAAGRLGLQRVDGGLLDHSERDAGSVCADVVVAIAIALFRCRERNRLGKHRP